MQWDPATTGRSEEANKGAPPAEFPFINVRNYLHRHGIRVPGILHAAVEDGIIVLEDLGDATMERVFAGRDLATRHALYERAVENLVRLQACGEKNRDTECVAFRRTFDRELYMWEFDHFVDWGIESRTGRKVPSSDRSEMSRRFDALSRELDAIPKGFTHRDYQSRNLMLAGGALCLIDFQDALLGPPQYDLVALLKDSYVSIDESETEQLVDLYLRRRADEGLPLDKDAFWRGFKVQTIQRKLKDAGRFVFIERVKKNPSFLPHIPQSLEYVRRYLSAMPELKDLHALLAKYTPEL
jgi:N-acetylmuramate 1-kinase